MALRDKTLLLEGLTNKVAGQHLTVKQKLLDLDI